MGNRWLIKNLIALMEADIPYQFVPLTGLPIIQRFCQDLNIPQPSMLAGNIVIGNLAKCSLLLTAHLDEVSFGFREIDSKGGLLAPYHKFSLGELPMSLTIVGIRSEMVEEIGSGKLVKKDGIPYCESVAKIKPGDRVVYHCKSKIVDDVVSGKAIDDRVGVLIVLMAAKNLLATGNNVAVVLSDGEEQIPDGYFSRSFPQVLHFLNDKCRIVFVDGIYRNGLEPTGYTGAPEEALIIPHSSFGKGSVVSPAVFSWLRDEIIPEAGKQKIKVKISSAYRSRGDEWGLITNPVFGHEFESFFVDFGAWGELGQEVPVAVNIQAVKNCTNFISLLGGR